jgi:hypothetical protein
MLALVIMSSYDNCPSVHGKTGLCGQAGHFTHAVEHEQAPPMRASPSCSHPSKVAKAGPREGAGPAHVRQRVWSVLLGHTVPSFHELRGSCRRRTWWPAQACENIFQHILRSFIISAGLRIHLDFPTSFIRIQHLFTGDFARFSVCDM